jgi:hypothetical protein
MCFAVKIAKSGPALYANSSIHGIHIHGSHSGKINDDSAIAEGTAPDIVAASTNCCQQIVRASEVNGRYDVGNP